MVVAVAELVGGHHVLEDSVAVGLASVVSRTFELVDLILNIAPVFVIDILVQIQVLIGKLETITVDWEHQ